MATKGWVFVLFAIIAAKATNTSAPGSIVEHVGMEGLRNSGDNGHTKFIFNDDLPGFAGRYWNIPSRGSMERLQRSMDQQNNSLSEVRSLLGKITAKDCGEIYRSSKGVMDSGIYNIYHRKSGGESNYSSPLRVFCRVEDGWAWTVIQRRQDGSVDFYNRTWEDYSRGFGNLSGEFWLGNDNIHLLTNQGSMATKGWVFVLFAIIAAKATNTSAPGSIVEHVGMEGLRNSGENGHTTFIFNDDLPGFAGRYWNIPSRGSMERLQRSMDQQNNSLSEVRSLLGKITAKDCGEIYRSSKGAMESGIYTIYPRQSGGESNYSAPLSVFCRVEDGRAWTVIQRRQDGSVDFYNRTWEDYSRGFGNLSGEFWLGNDNIHLLTNQGRGLVQVRPATYTTWEVFGSVVVTL
ncbi:hypothetical protein Bbelb_179780 [Branchiostoma belcheri]|nr:hypothetical protein Bbelb_179780 [Branchiostoma belcheri]